MQKSIFITLLLFSCVSMGDNKTNLIPLDDEELNTFDAQVSSPIELQEGIDQHGSAKVLSQVDSTNSSATQAADIVEHKLIMQSHVEPPSAPPSSILTRFVQ